MRRREFIAAMSGAVAWPLAARAQQADRVRRIGVLMTVSESDRNNQPYLAAFQQELRHLGWIKGRNLKIEYRWTAGDPQKYRDYGAELVGLKPDVICAQGTIGAAAVLKATHTIPTIFNLVADPIGAGFAKSIAHPGGNVTGFTSVESSIGGKWLDVLKEIAPRVSRVTLLFNPKTTPHQLYEDFLKRPAAALSIGLTTAPVGDDAGIRNAIDALAADSRAGLIVLPDPFTFVHRDLIVERTLRARVPGIYPYDYFVKRDGLMSYGIDLPDLWRRSAEYVDRILHGEKAGDLPIQFPIKYTLVINLKTAKALGLTVPPPLLATADEVIE